MEALTPPSLILSLPILLRKFGKSDINEIINIDMVIFYGIVKAERSLIKVLMTVKAKLLKIQ